MMTKELFTKIGEYENTGTIKFSDEETIRILKQCLISLEREASQKK